MSKINIILLVALVVQVGILATRDDGASTAETSLKETGVAGRQPFAELKSEAVKEIVLSGSDKKIHAVSKTTKNGDTTTTSWVLADRDDHPAKSGEAEKVIDTLRRAKFSRVLSRQAKRHAGLGVAESNASIRCTLKGEDGKILADVFLGESRQANATHFRMTGDDAVYAAADVNTWSFPTDASAWVETNWLDVPTDQVVKVRLTHEGRVIELVKDAPASMPASAPAEAPPTTWTVKEGGDGHPVDPTKVEGWIRGLGQLTMSDPVSKTRKPEHGFEKPTATATLVTADGKETVILIGAERKPQGDYHATATGRDYIVTLRSWTVNDNFKKKFEDLEPTSDGGGHEGHNHKD